MQKLYAFSGLGADKRVFSKFDLSGFEVVHIDWLEPRSAESLTSYVLRLANHYQIPKTGAYVIGVSFGGICVSELANYYDFDKIVLISSAKTKMELPKMYTLSKLFSVDKWIPASPLNKPNRVLNWFFGVDSREDKELLGAIVSDSDPQFVKWAIQQIMHWDNTQTPVNCLHIHGAKDRILPIWNIDYSIKIEDGGHFMIISHATEISFSVRNFLL